MGNKENDPANVWPQGGTVYGFVKPPELKRSVAIHPYRPPNPMARSIDLTDDGEEEESPGFKKPRLTSDNVTEVASALVDLIRGEGETLIETIKEELSPSQFVFQTPKKVADE